MKRWRMVLCSATFLIVFPVYTQNDDSNADEEIEELVVQAQATLSVDHFAELTATVIDNESIDAIQAVHPNELMSQVPGVWISRNSGQEHLTAIRSGMLTGAGACGTYLLLENSIPIRPTSFCNVNGLFELNTEQAYAIEVIRGPASSRYGGNALHGVINAITIGSWDVNSASLLFGSYGYNRFDARLGSDQGGVAVHASSTDGWRDDTGFDQYKLNGLYARNVGPWQVTHTLSMTTLNQETGGYVRGLDAYKDDALRVTNPNPEAFRDARSFRYASHWRNGDLLVAPFLRQSSMDFLMHFLPGQPLEQNAQRSGGVLVNWERNFDRWTLSFGGRGDLVSMELSEIQDSATIGSAFLMATRPLGTHYDFTTNASHFGLFHDGRYQVSDTLAWSYRIRVETASYDYDNRHLVGNTRDDGTVCGFGGCLYTRPADREDRFSDYAMQVGIERQLGRRSNFHASLGTGFRPPQIAELYRLQNGQEFADIESERLDAFEMGFKTKTERGEVHMVAYHEYSQNLIIRDSAGFNHSDGRVDSSGIEIGLTYAISANHKVQAAQTWASHFYDYTQDLAGREVITKGNDVDTAPRHLGSVQWQWQAREGLQSTLELTRIGSYFMDAANTFQYPGHIALHWHGKWRLADAWEIQAHVRNLFDKNYADRADWSFGTPRYFPAMPRNAQLGIRRYF